MDGHSNDIHLIPILNRNIINLCITETSVTGYIDGDAAYEQFKTQLAAAGCTYATRSSEQLENGKLLFSAMKGDVPVDFFQYPFQVLRVIHYECSHGGTYIPRKTVPEEGDSERKRRKLLQPTKKIGCEAKLVTKKIRIYPDYKIHRNHWMVKKATLNRLRADINCGANSFIRYHLFMTPPDSHNHAMNISSVSLNLNRVLIDKIYEFVSNKIVSVKDIKYELEKEVHRMFEGSSTKPDVTNSAFFPSEKTIRNHIYKAVNMSKQVTFQESAVGGSGPLVISIEEDKSKLLSPEEKEYSDFLQQKCQTNLDILTQITYLISKKDHLETLASDLKECIAKYKVYIKRKNTVQRKVMQRRLPIAPIQTTQEVQLPEIEIDNQHMKDDKSVELILTVL